MESIVKVIDSVSAKYENCYLIRGWNSWYRIVIEIGLSDFHKMTVTALLSHLPKLGLQILKNRDYKNFHNEKFWSQINKECKKLQNTLELDSFLNICNTALNKTSPLKQKYAWANNGPFMNIT